MKRRDSGRKSFDELRENVYLRSKVTGMSSFDLLESNI